MVDTPLPGAPAVITSRDPALHEHYSVPYTPTVAEGVALEFGTGKSLQNIATLAGMPSYPTLLRWYQTNPEFRKLLDGARAARALHHEEEAIAVGTSLPGKDDAAGVKIATETHKWAAEINDPTRYGKKTTIQGDPDKPVTFVIRTGVPAPTGHQAAVELAADGLVVKKEKPVEAEVVNAVPAT